MSPPAPRIVVVGSSNTDFVITSARIPEPGETVLGDRFLRAAGGKGANQAVAAARLGARVTFVARVGDDELGRAAVTGFETEGIDTRHVAVDHESPSGVALIVVDHAGENAIAVAPGANAKLDPTDVDSAADSLREADAVLLQLETPLAAAARAIDYAREGSARVILDPAPAAPLEPEFLSRVDVLTPNATEAAALAGRTPGSRSDAALDAIANELASVGVGAVVVTRGARGVLIATGGDVDRVPAAPARAVDSTAAGDAFSAALGVRLGAGDDLGAAVDYAQRAAARSVQVPGAQPSLPYAADLQGGAVA